MGPLYQAGVLIVGYLAAAGVGGFALLKSYEEIRKGIEKKSRFHLWTGFMGIVFLFIILVATIKGF